MIISNQLAINGTDISNYIAEKGIKWTRNDLDGPNAGRTLSGLMIRDRVAVKIKLEVTCRDLDEDSLRMIMNLIYPPFVQVSYNDPIYGHVTKTMYSNNNAAVFNSVDTAGTRKWGSITFPLIEQ